MCNTVGSWSPLGQAGVNPLSTGCREVERGPLERPEYLGQFVEGRYLGNIYLPTCMERSFYFSNFVVPAHVTPRPAEGMTLTVLPF